MKQECVLFLDAGMWEEEAVQELVTFAARLVLFERQHDVPMDGQLVSGWFSSFVGRREWNCR